MPDITDAFLSDFFDFTEKLVKALEDGKPEQIGEAISNRQMLIDNYTGNTEFSEKQKNLLLKIKALNEKANALARNFSSEISSRIIASKKMNAGLLSYTKTDYDLSSGQIVDKKR